MISTPVQSITPISKWTDARTIALATFDDMISLLEKLDEPDWQRQTECPAWNVADMVGHSIGNAKMGASIREAIRQQIYGMRHRKEFAGNAMDAWTDLQVRDHADLTIDQRIEELRKIAPKAVKGRLRTPRLIRALSGSVDSTGSTVGMPSTLNIGRLMDVVFTRDVWMHRIDIARATNADLSLRAEVDGRIVADVVGEWAKQHGQPFALTLDGPAGGEFVQGHGGPVIEMDAIEFCRTLSGREKGDGLLRSLVIF